MMSMMPQHRERLRDYVDAGDRSDEPLFVGREDLFERVASNLRAACKGHIRGRTLCLSGPPGIGKTAFLSECAKRHRGMLVRDPGAPAGIPVTVLKDQIANAGSILRALHDALVPFESRFPALADTAGRFFASLRVEEVGLFGARIKFTGTAEQASLPSEARAFPWYAVRSMLQGIARERGALPTVLLMVDEAHRINAQYARDLIGDLHEGGSVPVVPLFAGHVQTPDILEPCISGRYAQGNEQPVQCLSEQDARTYVHGILEYLHTTGRASLKHQVADWAVSECGGFPHHLRGAMAALAQAMLEADSLELNRLDGVAIASSFSANRVEYYAARLDGELAGRDELTLALLTTMAASGAAPNLAELLGLARDALEAHPHHAKGLDERTLVDALMRQGVIARQIEPSGKPIFKCLIASLHNYLASGGHPRFCATSPQPLMATD